MVRLRHRQQDTSTQSGETAPDVYPGDPSAGDHGLHVTDETCARCGREIRPTDEARRTASGDCVHLAC